MSDDDLTPSELRWRRISQAGNVRPDGDGSHCCRLGRARRTPWSGRSRPLFIQGKTLVVEAGAPSMVAFLRYGSSDWSPPSPEPSARA